MMVTANQSDHNDRYEYNLDDESLSSTPLPSPSPSSSTPSSPPSPSQPSRWQQLFPASSPTMTGAELIAHTPPLGRCINDNDMHITHNGHNTDDVMKRIQIRMNLMSDEDDDSSDDRNVGEIVNSDVFLSSSPYERDHNNEDASNNDDDDNDDDVMKWMIQNEIVNTGDLLPALQVHTSSEREEKGHTSNNSTHCEIDDDEDDNGGEKVNSMCKIMNDDIISVTADAHEDEDEILAQLEAFMMEEHDEFTMDDDIGTSAGTGVGTFTPTFTGTVAIDDNINVDVVADDDDGNAGDKEGISEGRYSYVGNNPKIHGDKSVPLDDNYRTEDVDTEWAMLMQKEGRGFFCNDEEEEEEDIKMTTKTNLNIDKGSNNDEKSNIMNDEVANAKVNQAIQYHQRTCLVRGFQSWHQYCVQKVRVNQQVQKQKESIERQDSVVQWFLATRIRKRYTRVFYFWKEWIVEQRRKHVWAVDAFVRWRNIQCKERMFCHWFNATRDGISSEIMVSEKVHHSFIAHSLDLCSIIEV